MFVIGSVDPELVNWEDDCCSVLLVFDAAQNGEQEVAGMQDERQKEVGEHIMMTSCLFLWEVAKSMIGLLRGRYLG